MKRDMKPMTIPRASTPIMIRGCLELEGEAGMLGSVVSSGELFIVLGVLGCWFIVLLVLID